MRIAATKEKTETMFSQIVEINLVGGDPISRVTVGRSPPLPCSTSHLQVTSWDLGKSGLLSLMRLPRA